MIAKDPDIDVHFPKAGEDTSMAYDRQPARPLPVGQEYARTTARGLNVRTYDGNQRARGGTRPGLVKYVPAALVSGWIVQHLGTVVEGGVQQSNSGRAVYLVAVSQGNVYWARSGDTVWTSPTNNASTPPLNYTGLMMSAANNQKLYFADGVNWVYFDPAVGAGGSVNTWAASAGSLPVDADNNTPRLICTWRGRTVLSGLLKDPHNIFMSKIGDPTNFDYGPLSPSAVDAFALNTAKLGLIGDVVTALVPYSDDVLIVGCDHEIWAIMGDPLSGGEVHLLSDAIGFAWGEAWCKDPYGTVYFFSNRCGVYAMVPGQAPQRISQQIENTLLAIDTGANGIRLIWDDRWQGLHIFVTDLTAPAATTHFFYETRSGAWWRDTFANKNFDPLATCVFDGNDPGDRVVLIGSWDGYVRALDPDATDDDGRAIASEVLIGPFTTPNLDDVMLKDLQGVLGLESGNVTVELLVGPTAEGALAATPVLVGTWQAGRNLSKYIRRAGHALYIRLTSTDFWAMETIRLRLETQGNIRRRGA